jgi:hypothetical protein
MGGYDAGVRARARAGPRALSVELWRLSDADRHGWAELAARTGWTEVEWFDVPGAFAWRHRLPGSWEVTWQQTYDGQRARRTDHAGIRGTAPAAPRPVTACCDTGRGGA